MFPPINEKYKSNYLISETHSLKQIRISRRYSPASQRSNEPIFIEEFSYQPSYKESKIMPKKKKEKVTKTALDYLFNGTLDQPWLEEEKPKKSKLTKRKKS